MEKTKTKTLVCLSIVWDCSVPKYTKNENVIFFRMFVAEALLSGI
jgi:hypothetical protein